MRWGVIEHVERTYEQMQAEGSRIASVGDVIKYTLADGTTELRSIHKPAPSNATDAKNLGRACDIGGAPPSHAQPSAHADGNSSTASCATLSAPPSLLGPIHPRCADTFGSHHNGRCNRWAEAPCDLRHLAGCQLMPRGAARRSAIKLPAMRLMRLDGGCVEGARGGGGEREPRDAAEPLLPCLGKTQECLQEGDVTRQRAQPQGIERGILACTSPA